MQLKFCYELTNERTNEQGDSRSRMYLDDYRRVTDICNQFRSEKLRCRWVLSSSSKKKAIEEKQQRRHLVLCFRNAAL